MSHDINNLPIGTEVFLHTARCVITQQTGSNEHPRYEVKDVVTGRYTDAPVSSISLQLQSWETEMKYVWSNEHQQWFEDDDWRIPNSDAWLKTHGVAVVWTGEWSATGYRVLQVRKPNGDMDKKTYHFPHHAYTRARKFVKLE